MVTKRPVIRDLKRSNTDVVLEVLAFAGILVLIALPALFYSGLPDSIPQHFNLRGEADGWGGKSTLLMLPALGVLLYAGLTVVSRFPHMLNYLWEITEENARRQYAISVQMMSAIKVLIVATFLYITWSTIETALGKQNGLNPLFPLIELPAVFLILGFYIYKAQRAK